MTLLPASSLAAAIFLGALQGLTEFLPVSSSGHLVLFQQFVEVGEDDILFDLVLHVGTLVPVLWFYRDTITRLVKGPIRGEGSLLQRPGMRMWQLLIAASIPTAVIGLLFEDLFEAFFATPAILALTFAITGGLLWSTRGRAGGTLDVSGVSLKMAIFLGIAQGFAITPGISRSGTTIAVALLLGIDREFAAKFSFLMSVPAISGAVLLKINDAGAAGLDPLQLVVGGLTSMIVGYGALVFLVRIVKQGQLSWFSWYCWGAAIAAGLIAVMR